jgi:thioester reductase-like protein
MGYFLLTGATGLLGSYLLRDGLRAGLRLALVVRPGRFESARQRIENILARHECEIGFRLPRPVVFAGDITQPMLGLDQRATAWVARHCEAVIHNAASLSFEPGDRQSEPWLSNLEGTRQMLELCRHTGIRKVHHVSTAYVAGFREGRILESELYVGQTLGNDYERSKLEAEQLVRAADFVQRPTVYRPAIIVGDAHTGYTSTFHGFYTPLKIIHALVDKIDAEQILGRPLMALLGLKGHECKNFVPVDWVSAAMMHIVTHPEAHGQTYHLTPRHAAPASVVCEVMEHVVRQYSQQRAVPVVATAEAFLEICRVFRQQMDVYSAYFRGDPEFDAANTLAAAPHLPCPDVDAAMLTRLAKYAIDVNFGWPRPGAIQPDFDVAEHLAPLLSTAPARTPAASGWLGLHVNGPGGGQYALMLDDGVPIAAEPGCTAQCGATLYMNSQTYRQVVQGLMSPTAAIGGEKILIEGDGFDSDRLAAALAALRDGVPSSATAARPIIASYQAARSNGS